MLSGKEIKRRVDIGDIVISDFDEKRLNPNSYNIRLGDELLVYDLEDEILDMKVKPKVKKIKISKEGYVLEPNTLYLGKTMEYTETYNLVPKIDGRSSIGRLGLFIHITAGFGDVGFKGNWTLEMFTIHPIKIYPGCEIGQLYYDEVKGEVTNYTSDKYLNQIDVIESKLYMDFKGDK